MLFERNQLFADSALRHVQSPRGGSRKARFGKLDQYLKCGCGWKLFSSAVHSETHLLIKFSRPASARGAAGNDRTKLLK